MLEKFSSQLTLIQINDGNLPALAAISLSRHGFITRLVFKKEHYYWTDPLGVQSDRIQVRDHERLLKYGAQGQSATNPSQFVSLRSKLPQHYCSFPCWWNRLLKLTSHSAHEAMRDSSAQASMREVPASLCLQRICLYYGFQ